MPVFVWEGKTRTGDIRRGEMNASSSDDVHQRLRQQDITPSKVRKKAKKKRSFGQGASIPTKSLVVFTRQFSTMVDAGLPLVQCLELLGNAEPHKRFKRILLEVRADVESGSTLASALAKHPGAFDSLYVSLVSAGEVAGILDTIMNRLATQIEKSAKLARRIKGAFTYPLAVTGIAILVVLGLLYKVIPTFAEMFADMGGSELPGPTVLVMSMSDFIQDNIILIVVGIAAFLSLCSFLLKYPPTRAIFDRFILKAPVFGPLVRKTAVARFTRTLGTMVASGVPIVDSLEIVAQSAGNMTIQKAILYVRERIMEGHNMVDPLLETKVFPDMVVQMIGVGESTGALDVMLNKIADFYEDEVDVAVDGLTSMLEPVMMVVIGGIVGGMLIAMYLPIFELAGAIEA